MSGNSLVKVLVVGQTPPPFGGQAISIQLMLKGKYQKLRLYHIRMAFSKEMDDIGKFRLGKLFHLLKVIMSVVFYRFRYKITMLYYVPAGPERIPMYRDMVILILVRWLFQKIIFQFRAAGISELYPRLSPVEKFFFRRAYFNADLAIRLSEYNPKDGESLQAKKNVIVPNGLEDIYLKCGEKNIQNKVTTILLYVGVICESKGILVLLNASQKLKNTGFNFKIRFMGKFESNRFRNIVESFISENDLGEYIEFLGVCTGDKKWKVYNEADVFTFPSYFESEAFPRVVLEAMHFEIPVVATRWRGIPSMVEDNISGFLVPIKDSRALADKIAVLMNNTKLRITMGKQGRNLYLERFTAEKFWHNIEEAFLSIE